MLDIEILVLIVWPIQILIVLSIIILVMIWAIIYLKAFVHILSRRKLAFPFHFLVVIFNSVIRLFALLFNTTANNHSHNNAQCCNTPNYYPDQSTDSYATTFVFVLFSRFMKELGCWNLKRAFDWGKIFTHFVFTFTFFFSEIFEITFIQTTFMTRQVSDQFFYYLVFIGEVEFFESWNNNIDTGNAENGPHCIIILILVIIVYRIRCWNNSAESKGIVIGLSPDRLLDCDTFCDKCVVVLHLLR